VQDSIDCCEYDDVGAGFEGDSHRTNRRSGWRTQRNPAIIGRERLIATAEEREAAPKPDLLIV